MIKKGDSKSKSWLNRKFLEWQNQTGERKSWKSFAVYLGVSPQSLSTWVNTPTDPQGDNLHILASKLGDEIYEILGVEKPTYTDVGAFLEKLPPAVRPSFAAAYQEFNEEISRLGISSESPEANEIIKLAFERHGITVKF